MTQTNRSDRAGFSAGDIVTPEAFQARLAAAAKNAPSEAAGLFGPQSTLWHINREALLFLGAGCAALLQLAHPWVATAIANHSRTRDDPFGRFHRTFATVFALVFGSRRHALARAEALYQRHAAVTGRISGPTGTGDTYAANSEGPLLWVHLTLPHTAMAVYERIFGVQSAEFKESYAQDLRRFAALFGIPDEMNPAGWQAFVDKFQELAAAPWMRPTPEAREMGHFLLDERPGGLPVPAWVRAITSELLPEPLRAAYALPLTADVQEVSTRAFRRFRRIAPYLPQRIRFVAPYQEALARVEGRPKPDLVTRQLNRFWIGRPMLAEGSYG